MSIEDESEEELVEVQMSKEMRDKLSEGWSELHLIVEKLWLNSVPMGEIITNVLCKEIAWRLGVIKGDITEEGIRREVEALEHHITKSLNGKPQTTTPSYLS